MKSKLSKVLHPVAGRPMVHYPLAALKEAGVASRAVVLGKNLPEVKKVLEPGIQVALQAQPLGTGHALMSARNALKNFKGTLVVLGGDGPLVSAATLQELIRQHRRAKNCATVLSAKVADPTGYGRILRDRQGKVLGIIEHREASPRQREIREINAGIYCFEAPLLWNELKNIRQENSKGEYYLTDLFAQLRYRGYACGVVECPQPEEILGVNNRVELAQAEKILRLRVARRLMEAGVTIVDPESTFIDDTVQVGADSVIQPFSFLSGQTRIEEDCLVGPFARVRDSHLKKGCQVVQSVVTQSEVGPEATVGPWSHLRPGTVVGAGAHLGNFCEFKKTRLGAGVHAAHLSYLGDATVGAGANIGAGTITANYDGKQKYPTLIGEKAFTGSGTVFVAPVKMGKGAKTGAGAVVLAGRDIPQGQVAVGVPAKILAKKK